MIKKTLICIIFLSFFNTSSNSIASTEVIVDEAVNQLIKNLGNIETATKGKKLKKFFTGNSLKLLFNDKIREFKFKENKYEIFENEKSIENGKWKLSGILKNQIKLTPNNKSKPYFLKKINNKEIIYHYNGTPGKEGTIKTLVKINPLIEEKTKVAEKKEEPKKAETKVAEKKEEPKKAETKVAEKKEEPKKAETKVADKKSGIKTKDDLEAFLIGTELELSGVYDGKTYITKKKFDFDGIYYEYSDGQKIKMVWEPINGNTFKSAQAGYEDYLGSFTYVLDYDNLTYTVTTEKTFEGNEILDKPSTYKGKILSPNNFVKKEVKERKAAVEIPEGQTVQILSLNCTGGNDDISKVYQEELISIGSTFEINFEKNLLYVTTSQGYGGTGKKRKHKDKILKYDDEKLVARGSPYLSDKNIGEYEIEYTFFYNPQGPYQSMNFNLFGNVNNKKYEMPYWCYKEYYFADNGNENTIQTYSDPSGIPKWFDMKLIDEAFAKADAEDMERTRKETEAAVKKFEEQISKETKNVLKSVSLKTNKYGSTQLEQSQKITNAVKKEDFKKYNVDSLISYYFFESLTYYLSSLELLYKAYDNNAEAEKLNSQIEYLKSSKASEKERLETTRQVIDDASKEIRSQVNDDSVFLTDEAKKYYQESLPYAYNATDSGYKLFVVSKGLVTEVKGSTNLLGTLLKNANELKGAITVAPLVPDYVKNIGKTAKLIFTGAKAKKIKDDENLSDALDELDLSA